MEVINGKEIKKLKITRFKIICFIIFLVLLVGASIYIIKNSIIMPTHQSKPLFTYNIKNNVDYKVHLFENNYYEEPYIGMNRSYPSDLIKSIEIDLINNLNLNKVGIIDYDYEITADINGRYTTDSQRGKVELWTRNFTLVPKKSNVINKKNNHVIREKIEIDFQHYNQIVSDFRKELRLNIDAVFNVQMFINYRIKVGNETVVERQVIEISYPLMRTAFEIGVKRPEPLTQTVYLYGDEWIINWWLLIIALEFLIIALYLFVKFLKKFLAVNKKTEYQNRLNKILKNYGDVIAESKTPPNFLPYDILEISDFNDLIDVQNEVRSPIIYYEQNKGVEGWFTIVHGTQLYRFILYKSNKEQKNYENTIQLKLK